MSEKKEFKPLGVGATERLPWELAQGLSKYVHFDKDGNAVIGKNLEVDGTTKLNHGFAPIHEYKLNESGTYLLKIFNEISDPYTGVYTFYGQLYEENPEISVTESYLAFGSYVKYEDIPQLTCICIPPNTMGYSPGKLVYVNNLNSSHTLVMTEYATKDQIPDVSTLQPKLYRHVMSLNNDDLMIAGSIVYISTSNLKVDSLQDLTTLLKPTNNYWYPLSGVLAGLDTNESVGAGTAYIKSHSEIVYENSTWFFTGASGSKDPILTVTDTVTTL